MKKIEINDVLQQDISSYSKLLKDRKEELNHYHEIMKKRLDDLDKASNEFFHILLDDGLSNYDAGMYTSEAYDSSYEDIYSYEDCLIGNIKCAEIRLKIALLAAEQIKYMSDDSEV